MENTQVIDPLFGLIEPEDSVFASLAYIDQLLISAESQSSWTAQAPKSQRPDTLLLHIDDKERSV